MEHERFINSVSIFPEKYFADLLRCVIEKRVDQKVASNCGLQLKCCKENFICYIRLKKVSSTMNFYFSWEK